MKRMHVSYNGNIAKLATNNGLREKITWKLSSLAVVAPLSSSSCSGTTIAIIAGMLLSPWYLHETKNKVHDADRESRGGVGRIKASPTPTERTGKRGALK